MECRGQSAREFQLREQRILHARVAVQMIANVIEPLAIQDHKTRAARDLLLPRLISGEIAV